MKLFEIDPDLNEIKLNREWLFLVPEFANLIRRDRGSAGDTQARRKLKAIKEFTYIYFMVDFGSPIRDYEDSERHKEALNYAGLTEKDIDDGVKVALDKYESLFLSASRALKTYKVLLKAQDAMDDYFEDLNFSDKDKKGELVNDPSKVADTVIKTSKMHDAIDGFAKKVEEQLRAAPTIRGAADLGDREGQRRDNWSESEIGGGSDRASEGTNKTSAFTQLGEKLRTT